MVEENPWAPENLYATPYEQQLARSREIERAQAAEAGALQQEHGGVWGVANTTANTPDANAVLAQKVSDYEAEQMAADEDAVRQQIGSQAPSPQGYGIAGAAGTVADRRDAAGDSYNEALLAEVQMPSRPNPVRPIREQQAAAYQDLAGQQVEARQSTAMTAAGADLAMADAYESEAGRQAAMLDAQQAAIIREQQRREDAIEGERFIAKQIQDATDKLAKTPDQDRGRYWSSRKWWQKLAWSISAIADGMRGLDPMAGLNSAIEGDLNDQRALYEHRAKNVQALGQQLQDFRSVYADLRSNGLDDVNASDAMRIARLEQSKAMLMAEQLRNGVPLQMAQQHEGILEMQQEINKLGSALQERLATTPFRIGGGRRPLLTGPLRKQVEQMQKRDYDEAHDLRMKGIDVAADTAKQERGAQIDIDKERAKVEAAAGGPPEAAQRRIDVDQAKWLAEKVEPYRNEERLITEYLDQYGNEIPGLAWGLGWQKKLRTDEQIQAKERLKRIVMVRLRRESGAAISESELSNDADAMLEAMDEDDVRNMLTDRLNEARSRIDYFERAPEEQAVERVNRGAAGRRSALPSGGAGLPDVIDYDDGE